MAVTDGTCRVFASGALMYGQHTAYLLMLNLVHHRLGIVDGIAFVHGSQDASRSLGKRHRNRGDLRRVIIENCLFQYVVLSVLSL